MAVGGRPTTDSCTVVVHFFLVASFLTLVATGLRIATDDPAVAWLAMLDAVLPMEHPWFRHLAAALVFAITLAGYAAYMVKARLGARVRLDGARLKGLLRRGKGRYGAINTLIYWGLMVAFAIEMISGTVLFSGGDHGWLVAHLWATWACLALVGLHVGCHLAIGGLAQLLRIVRPAALVMAPPPPDLAELLAEQLRKQQPVAPGLERSAPVRADVAQPSGRPARRPPVVRSHPAATALAVAAAMSATAVGVEQATRPVLHISEIAEAQAPVLDGDLSDPVWMSAERVTVRTTQGGDFGGSGQSDVEIRAVQDGTFVYFALVWSDPTRSLKHQPLQKTAQGWICASKPDRSGEDAAYSEDKFALLFARSSLPIIGAAIHLSAAPRSDRPQSGSGRGLHYTGDDSVADVWVWRASHGGSYGHVDNAHFGGAAEPTADEIEGRERYKGGFALDAANPPYQTNGCPNRPGRTVTPSRLPRDAAATNRALGRANALSEPSDGEPSRWWMSEAETIPYAKAADERMPVGTIVPGVVMSDGAEAGRTSIRGAARWAAGRWTLEIARRLRTGSPLDVPIKSGILMWVAAFDHSETRHTRHLRPLRLEVD